LAFEFTAVVGDLNTHKQSIIDSGRETYVWLGAQSKQQDNKLALELAKEFIEKAPDGRKRTVLIRSFPSFFEELLCPSFSRDIMSKKATSHQPSQHSSTGFASNEYLPSSPIDLSGMIVIHNLF